MALGLEGGCKGQGPGAEQNHTTYGTQIRLSLRLGGLPGAQEPQRSKFSGSVRPLATAQGSPLRCKILAELMTASGHLHALPRRIISVRFTPVSGIDSRSQALPGRANKRHSGSVCKSHSIPAQMSISGVVSG